MTYCTTLKHYLNVQDRKGYNICILCHQGNVDKVLHGPFQTVNSISAHFYCLLFASGLSQKGNEKEGIFGFLEEDIMKEVKRGTRLPCSHCKHAGATVGCGISSCRKCYHFPCGVESQMLNQFFDYFCSFCIKHQPKQRIPSQFMVSESVCMICQEKIEKIPSFYALWAPCCKKAWFHRTCLQKLALNAGHLFKCPVCGNNGAFCSDMKQYGIYISKAKASWEMEQTDLELFGRHKRCDKERCLCPQGREFNSIQTRWELRLCTSCGSKGVHVGCGGLNLLVSKWDCEDCKPHPQAAPTGKAMPPPPQNKGKNPLRKRPFKRTAIPLPESHGASETSSSEYASTAQPARTVTRIVKRKRIIEYKHHEESAKFRRTENAEASVSRNVAKRSSGPPGRKDPLATVRFIVREEPDEMWVYCGEEDVETLRAAVKDCLTSEASCPPIIMQDGREKKIWVWSKESSRSSGRPQNATKPVRNM